MKKITTHHIVSIIGLTLLFSIIRYENTDYLQFFYDVILSIVLTTIIDYVIVVRPKRKRLKQLLRQTEHFNCFVMKAAQDVLILNDIANKGKFGNWQHLIQFINTNKKNLEFYEQYFSDFSAFLNDPKYKYYLNDSFDKINLVGLDNDLVANYSFELSRFLTMFLEAAHTSTPLATLIYYSVDSKDNSRNIKEMALSLVKSLLEMYIKSNLKIENFSHSLSINGKIYIEAITLDRMKKIIGNKRIPAGNIV